MSFLLVSGRGGKSSISFSLFRTVGNSWLVTDGSSFLSYQPDRQKQTMKLKNSLISIIKNLIRFIKFWLVSLSIQHERVNGYINSITAILVITLSHGGSVHTDIFGNYTITKVKQTSVFMPSLEKRPAVFSYFYFQLFKPFSICTII